MMQAYRTEGNYRSAARLSAAELRAAMASHHIIFSIGKLLVLVHHVHLLNIAGVTAEVLETGILRIKRTG